MEAIDAIIEKMTHIPPFPENVPQLLQYLGKPEVDSEQVVALIKYDPALTTNVMRLCNSAIFGAAQPATDLQEAVLRLGFDEVYQLVIAVSSAKTLSLPQKGYGINSGELWKHSIATALAAKLLALDRDDDPNLVFTAGLLHDIGKVLLAEAVDQAKADLASGVEQRRIPMVEAERQILGVQHAEVGGRVLGRWKFSPDIVSAVYFHHDALAAGPNRRLATYVAVANMIAYLLGYGYGHLAFAFRGRTELLDELGLSADDVPQYIIRTQESLQNLKGLVNLKA